MSELLEIGTNVYHSGHGMGKVVEYNKTPGSCYGRDRFPYRIKYEPTEKHPEGYCDVYRDREFNVVTKEDEMASHLKFFSNPHDSLEYIVRSSLAIAKDKNQRVEFTYKDIAVVVSPNQTFDEILNEYNELKEESEDA